MYRKLEAKVASKSKLIDKERYLKPILKTLTPLLTAIIFVGLFLGFSLVVFGTGDKIFHGVFGFPQRMTLALTLISVIGLWVGLKFILEPNKRRLIESHGGWLRIGLIRNCSPLRKTQGTL